MQFKAFEKGIEVNGQTVYSIVDGFKVVKSMAHKILSEAGIGENGKHGDFRIDPAAWYPQEAWLAAFEQIAREVGESVLYQIGLAIPQNAKFPPWVKDIDSAIKSINIAYHMNHRKGRDVMFDPATGRMLEGIGNYGYQRVEGEKRIISVCENPYPSEFDRGILTCMAKKFEPAAIVVRDEARPCRRTGHDSCTYVIRW